MSKEEERKLTSNDNREDVKGIREEKKTQRSITMKEVAMFDVNDQSEERVIEGRNNNTRSTPEG